MRGREGDIAKGGGGGLTKVTGLKVIAKFRTNAHSLAIETEPTNMSERDSLKNYEFKYVTI